MSTTVDQRVVEMRFDNKQFENAAQTSLNTLEKLKKSLNLEGSSKGLEELKRASSSFSLDGMMSAVDALNNRFSTMGIVGMTVISNLTTAAMRFAKGMWDKTIGQIQSGGLARAMNIEQAKFQLQGLKVEWDKISEDINYGVRDTAYGLDAAAKAASQLVASGVQFGDTFGETGNSPMAKALRGISGVAAMTNSSYEEISHIFTTVAGQGKLMGMQLQQFANRGLNVAATLGEQLGYTETEIREFVTKGKIDFATFSEAMDKAFGEQATKANETYSGSLSNVKAALSRIGAKVATVYLEKMRDVFNALRPVINKVSEALDPFINIINSGITKASERVVKWLNKFNEVLTFMVKPITKVKEATEEVKKTVTDLAHVEEMAWKVIRGDYGNGQKRIDALRAEGECYELIQNKVNELLGCDVRHEVQMESSNKTLEEKAESIAEVSNEYANLWYWYYKIQTISDNAYKIFSNIKDSLSGIASAIGKAFKESNFRPLAKFVSEFVNQIRIFTKNFKMGEESSNSLTSTFKGLISVLKLLSELFMFAAEAAMILISPIFDIMSGIGRLTGIFGDLTTAEVDAFEATDPFRRAIHNLRKLIEPLRKAIRKLTDTILGSIDADEKASEAGSILGSVFGTVCKIFESLWEALTFVANKLIDGANKIKKYVTENEKLQNVLTTLKEAFMTIGGIILNVATNIGAFVKGFMDLPVVKKMIENVGNAFDKAYDLIKPFLDEAAKKVEEFSGKLKEIDTGSIDVTLEKVNTFFENLSANAGTATDRLKSFFDSGDRASGLINILENFPDYFAKLQSGTLFGDAISGGISDAFDFEGAKKNVEDLGETIKTKFGEINIGKVLGITFGSASVVSLLNFGELERSLSRVANSVSGIAKSLSFGISNFFKVTAKRENFSTSIIKIAAAIGILAASMYKLAKLPSKKLENATNQLLKLFTAVAGLVLLTSNVNVMFRGSSLFSTTVTSQISVAVLSIAGAITLLVLALKVLETVDIGKAKERFGVLIGLVAMVTAMAFILSKSGTGLNKGGLTLLFMALAVEMLSRTLIRLANADMEDTKRALKSLSVIMGMLAVLSLAARGIKFSSGVGLLAMVSSLVLLEKMLMYIAKDFEYGLVVGNLRKFVVIFGLMFALGVIARVVGKSGLKAGVGILAMAASIFIIAKAMQVIAKLNDDDLKRSRRTVEAIIAFLTAAGAIVGAASKGGDFKTVIAMAIAMGILLGELIILTNIDANDLVNATMSLGLIMVAFGYVISQMSTLNKKNSVTVILTLVGLVALMGMVGHVLTDLVQYDWHSIIAAGGAMALTIFAVGKAFEAIGKAKKVDQEKITNFILASASLIVIAIAISMIADKPWEGILAATLPLCACLIAIAKAFKIINGVVVNKAAIAAFIAGAISLIIIAGAIKILASEDWLGLLTAAGALSLVLIALTGSLYILSGIGPLAEMALIGIAVLDLFVIDLLGLLEFIGSFTDFEAAEKGVEAMAIIGKAIGEFIGSIIGGFGEAVTASLPQIGTNLSTFADKVGNFVDKVSNVKSDVADGAINLAGAILSITGGGLLSAFRKEGSVEEFGQNLLNFGDYIAKFYTSLVESKVEPSKFKQMAESVQILASLATMIPNTGGHLADWIGDNRLGDFGEQLKEFAPGIVKFSYATQFVDADGIKNTGIALKSIAEFAASVPNTGGKLATFLGDNTLGVFGIQLAAFGPNLAKFASDTADISTDEVDKVATAAKSVAEFASAVPNTGGKLATFLGDNTLGVFGIQLARFGPAFAEYAASVSGITEDTVKASSAAAKSVIAFANEVPNDGGLLGKLVGNNGLRAFGEELKAFGTSFAAYADSVSGISTSVVDTSMACANSLLAFKLLVEGAESGKSWWQRLTNGNELASFGQQVASFGAHMGTFYDSIKRVVASKVDAVVDMVSSLKGITSSDGDQLASFSDGLTKLGTEGIQNFLTGFEGADDKVKESISVLFKSIVDAVKSKSMQLQNAGKSAGAKFINGLSMSVVNASYIGSRYVAGFIEGLRSGSTAIEMIGANMGLGLARGLASQHDNIVNQAAKNATDAANAMAKATLVQSPSKVTYRIGRYVGMGFMLGIKALSGETVGVAEELAEDSINPFTTAINMISEAINNDIDVDPTIRPVVDLTNVTAGANQINAMFSRTRALSVAGSFRTNGASIVDGEGAPTQNFNFTQNNYSPKALSRLEIYRQTKNQFAQMRGAVSQA